MHWQDRKYLGGALQAVGLGFGLCLLVGCTPVQPQAAAAPVVSTDAATMVLVPTDDIAALELSPDTLVVANLSVAPGDIEFATDQVVVLGPLSSFSTLPPDAAVLIPDQLQLPETATVLGELDLDRPLAVGSDAVVILSPSADSVSDAADASATMYTVNPSFTGTLSSGASPEIVTVSPSQTQLPGVQFIPSPGATDVLAECVDWIQCRICMICGCCDEVLGDVLRYASPQDDLVLAPIQAFTDTLIDANTWIATIDAGDKPEIMLAPRSSYGTIPQNGLALVPRSTLPFGVEPAGDIYMSTIDPGLEFGPSIVIEQDANTAGAVTVEQDNSVLAFQELLTDPVADGSDGAPPVSIHIDFECPECDFEDLCKIDPVGCLCAVVPWCDKTE